MLSRVVSRVARGCGASTPVRALSAVDAPTVWKFMHGNFPVQVPMSEPLPGIPPVQGAPSTAVQQQVSTLSNGVRVVTDNAHTLLPSFGLFVNAGSSSEDAGTAGSTCFLQHAAFRDSADRTHFGFVRELETNGISTEAVAGRDLFQVKGDCHVDVLPKALDLLADTTLNPKLTPTYFKRIQDAAQSTVESNNQNGAALVLDAVHSAAYGFNGLGNGIMSPNVAGLTPEAVASFHAQNIDRAGNVIVTGAGVDHASFVQMVEQAFSNISGGDSVPLAPSAFEGGFSVANTQDGTSHVAIAFDGFSWSQSQDAIASVVLSVLLGGGEAFSSGGPGKGMTSVIFRNVLDKSAETFSANASSYSYANGGLFVLQGQCLDGYAQQLSNNLIEQLKSVASQVSEQDLARAVNTTLGILHGNVEHAGVRSEDLARTTFVHGQPKSATWYADEVAKVDAAAIQGIAKKLLASKYAVAVSADEGASVSYDRVGNMIR